MIAGSTPTHYRSVVERGVQLAAREDIFDDLHAVLFAPQATHTLYTWAQHATTSPALIGRGPVYVATLPRSGIRAVIRHNRHGGLLAPLTGDRFLPPTQAPAELAIARRLAAAGVPTADVVGYAVYPAGVFRRADVVTLEIGDSRDLSVVLTSGAASDRALAWRAVGGLVASLTGAGARHEDLNLKNILLQTTGAWHGSHRPRRGPRGFRDSE